MRRITLLLVGMLALFSTTAQRKNFTYKFYGFVRGDLFYNSRANMARSMGTFISILWIRVLMRMARI